jgi:4-amino-4-deoxy-L-arabinose transferase-like glycosyltransferase
MAKKSDAGTGVLLVVGAIIAGFVAAYEWATKNLLIVGIVATLLILGVVLARYVAAKRRQERFRALTERFGSEEIAQDIMTQKFWTGQTEEMLAESLGPPEAVDRQLLKTKRKEIWKYDEARKNQFSLRITLENGRVVSWDQKSA